MTNPKEALEWYERKRVEARAMADRDCNNCKHHKADGCSRWECEYEPVMSDLISRQDAINCCSCLHPEDCWEEIKALPSADRQEVESATINNEGITFSYRKKGKWVDREYCQVNEDAYEMAICSECGAEITICYYDNYCPNCGAKMERREP